MEHKKFGLTLFTALVLISILISGCKQSYSQVSGKTPTALPTNLFVSPLPTSKDFVGDLFTQTALALKTPGLSITTTGTPGTLAVAPTSTLPTTPGTPSAGGTPTRKPPPTITGTIIIGTTTVGRPATYVLQQGEFPYCIARRFNVNPNDLLSQNGLKSGQIVYAGFKLTIPQTGSFPGARALHKHPDSYTVSTASETIFGVACYYGDVDPMAIAQQNTIPAPYKLKAGQVLQIP